MLKNIFFILTVSLFTYGCALVDKPEMPANKSVKETSTQTVSSLNESSVNASTKQNALQISVQLHSVRDAVTKDFEATLKQIANMGFDAVEFAGRYGPYKHDPIGLRDFLNDIGLQTSGAHLSFKQLMSDERDKHLDFLAALGITLVIIPHEARIDKPSQIDSLIADLHYLSKKLNERGMQLGYHNHTKEFKASKNGTFWDYLALNTPNNFVLQLDVGWANFANADPIAYITKYPNRTLTAHIKVRTYQGKPSVVPADAGVILGQNGYNWQAIVDTGIQHGGLQWLVIEQEEYPEGMSPMASIHASLLGLRENIRL